MVRISMGMMMMSKERQESWAFVEKKIESINEKKDKLTGALRGDIPAYEEGMTPQELARKIKQRCEILRHQIFAESVELLDLQRIFYTIRD